MFHTRKDHPLVPKGTFRFVSLSNFLSAAYTAEELDLLQVEAGKQEFHHHVVGVVVTDIAVAVVVVDGAVVDGAVVVVAAVVVAQHCDSVSTSQTEHRGPPVPVDPPLIDHHPSPHDQV